MKTIWKPPHTAPEDGSEFLACVWKYGRQGGEIVQTVMWWHENDWRCDLEEHSRAYQPLCWLPLPAAPTLDELSALIAAE